VETIAPMDGGGAATITTDIEATAEELDHTDAILYIDAVAGIPGPTTPIISLFGGRLRVVLGNDAAPGNTYTYTLVIERRHSQIR